VMMTPFMAVSGITFFMATCVRHAHPCGVFPAQTSTVEDASRR
jgi:hypothetical protein